MASRNLTLNLAENLLTKENLPDLKEFVQGKLVKAASASDLVAMRRYTLLDVAIDGAMSPEANVQKSAASEPAKPATTAPPKTK